MPPRQTFPAFPVAPWKDAVASVIYNWVVYAETLEYIKATITEHRRKTYVFVGSLFFLRGIVYFLCGGQGRKFCGFVCKKQHQTVYKDNV